MRRGRYCWWAISLSFIVYLVVVIDLPLVLMLSWSIVHLVLMSLLIRWASDQIKRLPTRRSFCFYRLCRMRSSDDRWTTGVIIVQLSSINNSSQLPLSWADWWGCWSSSSAPDIIQSSDERVVLDMDESSWVEWACCICPADVMRSSWGASSWFLPPLLMSKTGSDDQTMSHHEYRKSRWSAM